MNWSKSIRQVHRWVAVTFTLVVVIVGVVIGASGQEEPAQWLVLSPLPLLGLLLFTGLYLFVLPYAAKWRSRRRTA